MTVEPPSYATAAIPKFDLLSAVIQKKSVPFLK